MAARRRRAIIEDDGNNGEPEPPPPHAPTPETVAQLEGREARSQRQPEIRLSRKNPRTQSYGLIFRGPPELVTPTWVQENIGGGEYKSELYGIRSDGKFGFVQGGLEMFEVDESIPFRGAPTAVVQAPAAAPTQPAPAAHSFDRMMEMGIFQLFKGMQDQAAETARQNREHSLAMVALMERIAKPAESATTPLLAAILPALLTRKDPTEIAAELVKLSGPKSDMASTMGMMREMMETMEFMRGGDTGGDPQSRWFSLAEKTLPGLVDLVKTEAAKRGVTVDEVARGPRATAVAAPAGPPAAQPSYASPTLPPQPVPAVTDEWTPLEGAMQQLHGLAGRDPHYVAGMALVIATDVQKAELKEKLQRENITDQIVARFPDFVPVRSWLDEVVYELQVELEIIDPDADQPVVEEKA